MDSKWLCLVTLFAYSAEKGLHVSTAYRRRDPNYKEADQI